MIRKIILGVLSVSFICAKVYGQNFFMGARIGALANAGTSISDLNNISGNPAGFTSIQSPSIALGYEQRFLSKELGLKTALIGYPLKANFFGLSVNSFGERPYTETAISLSYGRAFGPNFSGGLKFNYHSVQITNYGQASAFTIELGFQAKIMNDVTLGTHVINPNRSQYSSELQNPLLTIYRFGVKYDLSDQSFIVSEIEKVINYAPSFKAGIEFGLVKSLALRGGFSTNPFKQSVGVGVHRKGLQLDVAANNQPLIGLSPQMSVAYAF